MVMDTKSTKKTLSENKTYTDNKELAAYKALFPIKLRGIGWQEDKMFGIVKVLNLLILVSDWY